VLTPQEFREQADLCIDRARTAGSAAERKLYRRLALTWLEIVIRIEPRAIELRDAIGKVNDDLIRLDPNAGNVCVDEGAVTNRLLQIEALSY